MEEWTYINHSKACWDNGLFLDNSTHEGFISNKMSKAILLGLKADKTSKWNMATASAFFNFSYWSLILGVVKSSKAALKSENIYLKHCLPKKKLINYYQKIKFNYRIQVKTIKIVIYPNISFCNKLSPSNVWYNKTKLPKISSELEYFNFDMYDPGPSSNVAKSGGSVDPNSWITFVINWMEDKIVSSSNCSIKTSWVLTNSNTSWLAAWLLQCNWLNKRAVPTLATKIRDVY